MEPGVIEKACLPFYTTKKAASGSGLGLNQVRNFVCQSGGHVQITSTPCEGTEVGAYLPRLSTAVHGKRISRDRGPSRHSVMCECTFKRLLRDTVGNFEWKQLSRRLRPWRTSF